MEKLDLQTFRNLKQEVINYVNRIEEIDESLEIISDEENDKLLAKYKEIIDFLSKHDLSDIDFKEWQGMFLQVSEEVPMDFSKTKAKLDFSIIDYARFDVFPNFKNCEIRNFNFNLYEYRPEMFDEKFIKENQKYFLSEEAPENLKKDYYTHSLSLKVYSDNLEYFKGKAVSNNFNIFNEQTNLFYLYGDDIYQLFSNYKPLMDKIIDDENTDWGILRNPMDTNIETEEDKKNRMKNLLVSYFKDPYQIDNFQMLKMILDFVPLNELPFFDKDREIIEKYGIDKLLEYGIKDLKELAIVTNDLYEIRDLMKTIPLDLIKIGMGANSFIEIQFIQKYGIDNIIRLDEETNGMFSHKIFNDSDIYLLAFAYVDRNSPQQNLDKELTYDEFKNRMYELLVYARDEDGFLANMNFPDYDFITGEFRKEHQDIFLDGDIDPDIKRKFYNGRMTANDIREHPELINLLQGKDLGGVFHALIFVDSGPEIVDENGNVNRNPKMVNLANYFSNKLGQEEFLKICATYGVCFDSVSWSTKDLDFENIRESIEDKIYKDLKRRAITYFDDLPSSFKEKHPELFLPKNVDEEFRNKFYSGRLSFEDIRENPQLKEVLVSKDLSVGFRASFSYQISLWNELSNSEILDLLEKYGKYLRIIDLKILRDSKNVQDRDLEIETSIEKLILDKKVPFLENIPKFFKDKHPEFVLADDTPEVLKQAFYSEYGNQVKKESIVNFIAEHPEMEEVFYARRGECIFPLIKEHPEWREFLKGKDLRLSFSKDYDELFKRLDNTSILKLGTRDQETIRKMVDNHRESTLENWYNATGRKFVPNYVVMLNFPEGEIDNFLANSKKWNRLMKIEGYNSNENMKTSILKAAYCFGVFEGDDKGLHETIKLFTGLPKYLTPEEFSNINDFIQFTYDSDKKEMFQRAYQLREDGKYSLRLNEQKEKRTAREIRDIMEQSDFPRIITPEKAHKIFDSFSMDYNPNFVKFFNENANEIITNSECTNEIAKIQRQFKEIERINAGRRLTMDLARDYIRTIAYSNIDIGNEQVAEQAKIVGYSQDDFEVIQRLYNEGETRDFSSIPRVTGKVKGYTYEMLRCDDPLALTIGDLTDCCQKIHGAGKTSMEHSMVSPDGRVFCVKDEEGIVVAQSWFWRNQYTGCFDNIEIPDKIFETYEKDHPTEGRKGLTKDVLEVYKRAASDLMQEDKRVYDELLEEGTITQEQYDSLLLGKVTIGLGYNDIAQAIETDTTLHIDEEPADVISTQRVPSPYTDAYEQYVVAERDGIVKSDFDNLRVHQDDVPVYDGKNMNEKVLLTIRRMEQVDRNDNIQYFYEKKKSDNLRDSQIIINELAEEYGLNPSTTKVMATARMALIYSQDKDEIKIGDVLSAPLKKELTLEQKQKANNHIRNQVKRALQQVGVESNKIDMSSLDEDKQKMLQSVIDEIKKEKDKRGER